MQDPFKNTVNMVAVSGLNRDANAALIAAAPDMFEALGYKKIYICKG